MCTYCSRQGDQGAEFCKFCGVRYGGAPPAGHPMAQHPLAQQPAGHPTVSQARAPKAAAGPELGTARIVSVLKDGTDGPSYELTGTQTDLGATEGDVLLRDDPYVSPRHARISSDGSQYVLKDLDSVNGTYVRIGSPVELHDGDMILIGQQVLRFETLRPDEQSFGSASTHGVMLFGTPEISRAARLCQYTTEGVNRDIYYLFRERTVLGREVGDLVFTDDPFLSRRHAAIRAEHDTGRFFLEDLGASNGTAIRLRGEHRLTSGDFFRLGRHLFRFQRPTDPNQRVSG